MRDLYDDALAGGFVYPEGHRDEGEPLNLRSVMRYRRLGRLEEFRLASA